MKKPSKEERNVKKCNMKRRKKPFVAYLQFFNRHTEKNKNLKLIFFSLLSNFQHEQKMLNGEQHVNGLSNGHSSDKHKSSHKSSSKDKHRDKERSKDHKSSKSSHR